MSATGFKLQYQDANNATQTVALELLPAIEGGKNVGNPKLSFKSHGPSELAVRFPAVSPDVVTQIPFESQVVFSYTKGATTTNLFVGRRISRPGQADARGPYVEYTFQDAWYDLSQITFKQVWFGAAYQPCTLVGTTLTFQNQQLGDSANSSQAILYSATGVNLGVVGITWTNTTQAVVTGFTGSAPAVKSVSVLYDYPDVVLYQFRPVDPYQNASQVVLFYITTGEQLIEVLNFAIGAGANLQYVADELNNTLTTFAPWYPARAMSCADAIKHCLRLHPDCFTEIDYSTTPPTFHVRKRNNPYAPNNLPLTTGTPVTMAPYGTYNEAPLPPTLLNQITLPYESTAGGRRHIATSITPRPELVPSRIGIFYRYIANGVTLAFPTDIYPIGAPDGLRAKDYSLDLQGPSSTSSQRQITSVPFDPTNVNWWLTKCATLRDSSIPPQGQPGCAAFAVVPGIKVTDDNGNLIDYINSYPYEFVSGTVDLWMSGVSLIVGTASANFTYVQKDPNSAPINTPTSHSKTTRVKLLNVPSELMTFTQFLSTGEAIPSGLAQSIYTALQSLQYNLNHTLFENPFSASFIKPGLNGVNLSGGDPAWLTMNSTVQESEYILHADNNGNSFADIAIRCGPVQHLEAGQLVQIFNLFQNRDILKINPWERITGTPAATGIVPPTNDTALENSDSGHPKMAQQYFQGQTPDGNGNVSRFTISP